MRGNGPLHGGVAGFREGPRPLHVAERHRLLASALLLACSLVVLLLFADKAIDDRSDAHLFLAWLALWAVIFTATAMRDRLWRAGTPRHL